MNKLRQIFFTILLLQINSICANGQTLDISNSQLLGLLIDQGVDVNEDGLIQQVEADSTFSLSLHPFFDDLKSLDGIQYFTNLEYLDVSNNELDSVDVSNNLKLKYLNLSRNDLTGLDCSNNAYLEYLNCERNFYLKDLHLPQSNSLIEIYASSIEETHFDFSGMNRLKKVFCSSIEMESINLSGCSALEILDLNYSTVSHAPLDLTLDVSNCLELRILKARQRTLGTLNLLNNPKLEHLDIKYSRLNSLDLSQNPNLKHLTISTGVIDEMFTELDLSNNPQLTYLFAELHKLSSIDLSQNPLLDSVFIRRNKLTTLDLTHNPLIKVLEIGFNDLTEIDLGPIPDLELFECYSNDFEQIDFSNNLELKTIYCHGNDLKTIDVSNNHKLERLNCSRTHIEKIDISSNPVLYDLRIEDNDSLVNVNIQNGIQNSTWVQGSYYIKYVCKDEEDNIGFSWPDDLVVDIYCNFASGEDNTPFIGSMLFSESSSDCNDDFVPIQNAHFEVKGSDTSIVYPYYSDDGKFELFFSQGQFSIRPLFNDQLFQIEPSILDLNVTNQDTILGTFCITPSSNLQEDVYVKVIPLGIAQPGFKSYYKLIIGNHGNTTSSGNVSFNYPHLNAQVEEASEPYTIIDTSMVFSYDELTPFSEQEIFITLRLNPPVGSHALFGGEILKFAAEIDSYSSDYNVRDNFDCILQTVVNSYDPNDKVCLEGNQIVLDSLTKPISYRIRFENTGTAEARNVIILDTLDAQIFDPSSVRLIDFSHDCYLQMNDNILEFIFRDINLPFEDELNDGYVIFEVMTLGQLETNDQINNKADIIFDFNSAIKTNTYSSIIIDDNDGDGFFNYEDCNDNNSNINPDQPEEPYNGIDDDCNAATLDDDLDQDGFVLADDCNDSNSNINPDQPEEPYNGIDDDCNSTTLDDDIDQDGFILADDCNDNNSDINPNAEDIPNNGIDENCDGMDMITGIHELDKSIIRIYPNPVFDQLSIKVEGQLEFNVSLFNLNGKQVFSDKNIRSIEMSSIPRGTYLLEIKNLKTGQKIFEKIVVGK